MAAAAVLLFSVAAAPSAAGEPSAPAGDPTQAATTAAGSTDPAAATPTDPAAATPTDPAATTPSDPVPSPGPATRPDPTPAPPATTDAAPPAAPASTDAPPQATPDPAPAAPAADPQPQPPASATASTPPSSNEAPTAAAAATTTATAAPSAGGQTPVPGASAQNVSVIYQAIWQTQKGCQSHCTGTSQIQSATEAATTHQTATATGDPESASGAEAVNAAVTVQFIVQTQVGCLAFCYATTQVQSASQSAQTTQLAGATADAVTNALNVSSTFQFVWQIQQGCAQECHDATSTQSAGAQEQTDAASNSVPSPFDDPAAFAAWLSALAANHSATVQLIVQYEQAPCLENCAGDAQVQEAKLVAVHVQVATATLAKPAAALPPAAVGSLSSPTAAARPSAHRPTSRHRRATRRTWSWWMRNLAHRHSSGRTRV